MDREDKTGLTPKGKRFLWLKPLLLIAIVTGLSLVLYRTGLVHFFLSRERMGRFLESLGPLSALGFVFLQAAQVVISPIPGEATGLLGGYLYGPYLGTALSVAGLTIGSYIAFSLSRAFGRPFVEWFVKKETMKRFDFLLHEKGAVLVFLLFLIPGFPKDILCYIIGLGHLTTVEFLVIVVAGRLFGTVLLTVGGNYLRAREYARFFYLAGAGIVATLLIMAYRDRLERFLHGLRRGRRG